MIWWSKRSSGHQYPLDFGFFLARHLAPPALRRGLLTVTRLITAAIGLFLTFWGGALLRDGWAVPMAGAPLPQGLYFLPICVGGALIALFALELLLWEPARGTDAQAQAAVPAALPPRGLK